MLRSTDVLERDSEMAALAALLDDAVRSSGRVAVVEGPPGIGKTELLHALRARADGFEVLAARGGELETGLTFGITRQLLEPAVARLEPAQRSEMLSGPARPAAAIVGLISPDGEPDEARVFHALHLLVRCLAERRPLLLCIDDAHWADTTTLRWLTYLSRRLETLPVLMILAVRTTDAHSDILAGLAIDAQCTALRLSPLSEGAVIHLVRTLYRVDADEAFCRACHAAAGGNPFFVREMVRAVAAGAIRPSASEMGRVADLTPDGLLRSVSVRLQRLPGPAAAVAAAAAVLGGGANLRITAALTGVDVSAAARAADSLIAAGILAADRQFLHPVIRTVVYHGIPAGERGLLHGRAARLLAADHARPAVIANHLLVTEPTGDEWVADMLRRAAAQEPSPERIATYLRRALVEPPPEARRGRLLFELGRAESAQGSPAALEPLREALDRAEATTDRARTAQLLGRGLWLLDRRDEAARFYRQALDELAGAHAGSDHDLLLEIEAEWIRCPGADGWSRRQLQRLRRLAGTGDTPGRRALLSTLAYIGTFAGLPASEVAKVAEEALAHGDLFAERPDVASCFYPVWALQWADRLDSAKAHAGSMLRAAEERGWLSRAALARWAYSGICYRQGELAAAETAARAALDLTLELDLRFMLPPVVAGLVDVYVEQGRYEDADRAVSQVDADTATVTSSSLALFRHSRGRLRAARGDLDGATEDFLVCGELLGRSGHDHPAYQPWRSSLAIVHHRRSDGAEARRLAAEEVERARTYGAASVIGVALRVAGIVEPAERQYVVLAEAVQQLESSPARLELARALVDFGASLRRGRHPAAAREALRRGLDLAQRCSAGVLAQRAGEELAAAGGRPRRSALFGVEALTASEARVARLAADGLTNPEIARELFVNVKTVEKHLGQVYQKLGVTSRRQLRDVLSSPVA